MNAHDPVPSIWTTGTSEVFKTGTWRTALPRHIQAPSPCHAACPVNGDIAEWIGHAHAGDLRGAWEILTRHNPFPAIAGRICHHPCEVACNRSGYDASVAICRLERHVGDAALAAGWSFTAGATPRVERIAIVGAGPSGLSAAFHLRRRGYAVTLFESSPELGGVMRRGIPGYRLPRSVLDGEIARIVALGVDVRCGESIATAAEFGRLRAGFDAVYIATGACRQKRLPQIDYRQAWVMDGADYLAQANAGMPPVLGKRIAVIGGGSAAIDVARSARRAGHDVTIVVLEAVSQMPAQAGEVVEALEEGITILNGAMLVTAGGAGQSGVALNCIHVHCEPGAARGQWTVTPLAGTEFTLDTDAVITAIGQDPELGPFLEMLASGDGLLLTDRRQATNAARVYAGGDVASMARFVTEAIGMGKRAAQAIHAALGSDAQGAAHGMDRDAEAIVAPGSINTFYHPKQARVPDQRVPASVRLDGDAEVHIGLDVERALAEAARCFSCGTCTQCDNCVRYCPDLAVERTAGGYIVLTDYCKGCGLCVRECPTGSMRMVEEAR
ncbi:MAG: FAD-dependent oxidoreductase [Betaproteobacteria bacterium]